MGAEPDLICTCHWQFGPCVPFPTLPRQHSSNTDPQHPTTHQTLDFEFAARSGITRLHMAMGQLAPAPPPPPSHLRRPTTEAVEALLQGRYEDAEQLLFATLARRKRAHTHTHRHTGMHFLVWGVGRTERSFRGPLAKTTVFAKEHIVNL